MKHRPPAFQVYAADWLERTADLSLEEQGAVHRLLCHQWRRGPLPNNRDRLARLLVGLPKPDLDRLWPVIEDFFPLTPDHRRANSQLEVYRAELEARRRERSESGQKGAATRWGGAGLERHRATPQSEGEGA